MKVQVFAVLKGFYEKEFELRDSVPNISVLKDRLIEMNPAATDLISICRFAVKDDFIDNEFQLEEHDTIYIIPREAVADPVFVTESPLDISGLLAGAHHPQAGAIVLFSGDVRNHSNGKDVEYLEYEAQVALASKMISDIISDAKQKWKLSIALATHRIGKVPVSESAVVVITASVHRSEAYASNRYIIDRIKHEVPIWKCEFFTNGTKEWGGNCNCHTITGEPGKHIYDS